MTRSLPTKTNFPGIKTSEEIFDLMGSIVDPSLNVAAHSLIIDGASTADNYVFTLPSAIAIAAYAEGQMHVFTPPAGNTTAVNATIDGLPSREILTINGGSLSAGDLIEDRMTLLRDDGTGLRIMNSGGTGTEFVENVQEFTGSGSWTKPDIDGRWVDVICIGGGGGGVRNSANTSRYGPGGGGGGFVHARIPFSTIAASITVTIGSGGTTTDNTVDAVDGGDTSFGSLVIAEGGEGPPLPLSNITATTLRAGGVGGGSSVSGLANIVSAELGGSGGMSANSQGGTDDQFVIENGFQNFSIAGRDTNTSGPGGSGADRNGTGTTRVYGIASRNAFGATGGTENENATGFGAGGSSVGGADTEQAGTSGFCRVWVT